jgi:hypothetical protein
VPLDDLQRLADLARGVIGAEVAGTVLLGATHHVDARPLGAVVDAQVQETLVVLELDVEARLVLLDELVL